MFSFFKQSTKQSTKQYTIFDQETSPPEYNKICFKIDMGPDYDVDNLPSYEQVIGDIQFHRIQESNDSFDKLLEKIKKHTNQYFIIDSKKYKSLDIICSIIRGKYDGIVLYRIFNQISLNKDNTASQYFSVDGEYINNNDEIYILGTINTIIKCCNFTSKKYNQYNHLYPYYEIYHNNGKYISSVISYNHVFCRML
jgi:hypothetical protein